MLTEIFIEHVRILGQGLGDERGELPLTATVDCVLERAGEDVLSYYLILGAHERHVVWEYEILDSRGERCALEVFGVLVYHVVRFRREDVGIRVQTPASRDVLGRLGLFLVVVTCTFSEEVSDTIHL